MRRLLLTPWLTSQRPRRWCQWSLRGMLLAMTAVGIWLGIQVNWLRERQAARAWIEAHEIEGGWSRADPRDVRGGRTPYGPIEAPWTLRIFGESRLVFIHLDKSKLSEEDIPRIDSLPSLFPEAESIHVFEPGWSTCWPPADRKAFLKYPTRLVGGMTINRPAEDSPSEQQ